MIFMLRFTAKRREARDVLGRDAEDVRDDVAEVPELRVGDRHRLLLAQAAQRLAMLLGESAAPLGTLTIGAGQTMREIPALRGRRHLGRGRALGFRGAHTRIVVVLARSVQ